MNDERLLPASVGNAAVSDGVETDDYINNCIVNRTDDEENDNDKACDHCRDKIGIIVRRRI